MDIDKVYKLISDKITNWSVSFVKLLPNLVIAILILVLGFYLAKIIKKFSLKMITKVSHLPTINNLFASFMYLTTIGITIFVVLDIVNLDKAVTTALAGAGILGLALAFAFQDIAANFMSGVFISFRKPFNIGDLVEIKVYMGRIESINLRDTSISTLQGQRVIIPNKEIFQNPIKNYTSTYKRRLDLKIGISYGEDLEKVRAIVIQEVSKLKLRDESRQVEVFFVEFNDSSIDFNVRVWLSSTEQVRYQEARSETIILIKKAFDEQGIIIPFPITTLDFGIKGGEKLSETIIKTAVVNKNKTT